MEISESWQSVQRKGEKMLSLLGKSSVSNIKDKVFDYLLFILLIFGVGFCSISCRTKAISMGYEIGALQQKKKELENTYRCLKIESSSLSSLNRIEKIATENYGLKVPERIEVVFIPCTETQLISPEYKQESFLSRCYQPFIKFLNGNKKREEAEAEMINYDL